MKFKKSSLSAVEYLKKPGKQNVVGIGNINIMDRNNAQDLLGPENATYPSGSKVWLFDHDGETFEVSYNNQLHRVQVSGKGDKEKVIAFRNLIVSEYKKHNLSGWEKGYKAARSAAIPGWKWDGSHQLAENMFARFRHLFSPNAGTHTDDKTKHYEVMIDVWTYTQRGVTITIYKGEKVVWELKSNNPNSIQTDEQKLFHMLKSLHIDINRVKMTKRLNGKVIDTLGESTIDEARRPGSFNSVAPPHRNVKVGDYKELNDRQVEIVLPRNDLDTRKKLLKPLIDSGCKIINQVKNGRMDIVTLSKPLNEEIDLSPLEEYVLTIQQRRKRAMTMRKFKNKISQARARKAKRLATNDQLTVRARRMAIQLVRRRFAGKMGADYKSLSPAQKIIVDKKVEKKKALVKKIALRILPKVRKMELARFRSRTNKSSDQGQSAAAAPSTTV